MICCTGTMVNSLAIAALMQLPPRAFLLLFLLS